MTPLIAIRRTRVGAFLSAGLLLAACRVAPDQALGTLEYDRITLPSPAAERVSAVEVHEGQRVKAGQSLLRLETARAQATTQAAEAQVRQQAEVLAELRAGPRAEAIARARAQVEAAQAQARDAQAYLGRLQPLGRRQLVAAADVDRARAAAGNAVAQVLAAQAALSELEHGTRAEQLAQAAAAVQASQAQATVQSITLERLDLRAPRDGIVDSLPYRTGDQAPIGAPLVVLLVGPAPYARIYVAEPLRAGVQVGDRVQVRVAGNGKIYSGQVRSLRSEPSFTPYYALAGKDAARLSYLAEVQLGADAAQLPAGLPVAVDLPSR